MKVIMKHLASMPAVVVAGTFKAEKISLLDKQLNTPLHYFANTDAQELNPTIIQIFKRHIDKVNTNGQTALDIAIERNNVKMVRLLLEHGGIVVQPEKIKNVEMKELLNEYKVHKKPFSQST